MLWDSVVGLAHLRFPEQGLFFGGDLFVGESLSVGEWSTSGLNDSMSVTSLPIFLYFTAVNYNPRNKLTTSTVQTYTSHTHMELGSRVLASSLRP